MAFTDASGSLAVQAVAGSTKRYERTKQKEKLRRGDRTCRCQVCNGCSRASSFGFHPRTIRDYLGGIMKIIDRTKTVVNILRLYTQN
ncbi:hypothetical protein, partial [Mycobacterium intracellulare]|uniref:hypothetical protein n=1 Tax=Mycobacterium intracellulare TaxID=1767 RepID=UPI001CDACD36